MTSTFKIDTVSKQPTTNGVITSQTYKMADLGGVGGEIIYEEDKKKLSIYYVNNVVHIVQRERPSTPIINQDIIIDEEDLPSSQNIPKLKGYRKKSEFFYLCT